MENTNKRIEKLKSELSKTKDSMFFYEAISASLQNGIIVLDKNNMITYVNNSLTEILDYNNEELADKVIFDFLDNRDKEILSSNINQVKRGRNLTIDEYKFTKKNGKITTLKLHLTPVFKENNIYSGIIVNVENDSENKEIRLALKTSKHHFQEMFNHSHIAMIIHQNNLIIKANKSAVKLIEANSLQDLLKRNIFEIVHPETTEIVERRIEKTKKLGKSLEIFQGKLLTLKGNTLFVEILGVPHVYNEGKAIHVIIKDITKQKKTAEELKKNHEKLKTILNAFEDGVYLCSSDYEIQYLNPGMINKIGYNAVGKKCYKAIYDLEKPCSWCYFNELKLKKNITTIEIERKEKYYQITSVLLEQNSKLTVYHDITKIKKTEKELKLSEERFKQLSNLTFEGIIIHKKGIAIDINLSFAKMFGYTRNELLGENVIKLLISEQYHKIISKNIIKNYAKPYEVEGIKKDGSTFPIEIEARDYLLNKNTEAVRVAAVRDITERKKAEKEIRKLLTAVQQSPLCILITDINGNIEYTNPMFTYLTGYRFKEVKGKNPRILQSGNTPKETYTNLWETITHGKIWQGEFINIKKNGEEFIEYAVIAPITDSNGKTINYIALKNDITRRKKIEFELKKQNEEYAALNEEYIVQNENLLKAKQKAEESNRLKSAFLANMSHEIRTPMNSILGFSELLGISDLSEDKKKSYINTINKSTMQLLSIIENILNISKLEAGLVTLNKKEININLLLLESKNQFAIEAEKKGLRLKFVKFLNNKKVNLYTDEVKLKQIITNLLSNAIKFTHKGEIEFGCKLKNNFIEFYVKDTGIGISLENQKIIFERFRQVELTKSRIYGGNGLGLSISEKLTHLLGGTMWLNSEPENLPSGKAGGSIFYFTIPYIQKPARIISTAKKTDEQIETPNWSKLTIMIAEDEKSNYIYLEEILEETNVKLIHALNGKEAVELCRINKKIDMVLMDIKMPVMDGYEATKAIKKIRPDLPVIIQTAYAYEEDREKIKDTGYDDFITKPIKRDDFIKTIKKHLK